jgi:hypothetical protein
MAASTSYATSALDPEYDTPSFGAVYARRTREVSVPASCTCHYEASAVGRAMKDTIARAVEGSEAIARLAAWGETAQGAALLADFQVRLSFCCAAIHDSYLRFTHKLGWLLQLYYFPGISPKR